MIVELRNKIPFISFNFNTIERVAYLDDVIDIYLRSTYNQDVYKAFEIGATGATVKTIINNYHYQVAYDTAGLKNITITIEKGNPLQTTSNTLILDVRTNSFDSDTVGFDNAELTFDIF